MDWYDFLSFVAIISTFFFLAILSGLVGALFKAVKDRDLTQIKPYVKEVIADFLIHSPMIHFKKDLYLH